MKKRIHSDFDPNQHPVEFLRLLAYAFDQLDTLAGVADINGKVLFANQSALRNVGATAKNTRGVHFRNSPWRSQSRNARRLTDKMIAKALSGESSLVEDFIVGPDGSEVPVLFSISPITDIHNNVIGFVPEGKVISDIKNLEQNLRKEKKGIQQWIDSMSAYIAKSDPNGKIVNCNRAFMKAFSTCFEEVNGAYICDLTQIGRPKDEKNLLKQSILNAKNGSRCSLEVLFQLNQTSPGTYLFNANPIKDLDGRISFLALEITDISEQVRLREQILDEEKRYAHRLEQEVSKIKKHLDKTEQFNRNLVESVPMGVLYLDESGRVVYANPKMKEMFQTTGISKANITSKTIEDLGIRPATNFWKIDQSVNPTDFIYGRKKMVLCKGEEPRFCLEVLSGPLVSPDRSIKGTVLTINDITDNVRLETDLLNTRIQTEKMSSMGLLISGVAHELNNPLTSIIGCAEFLASKNNIDANAGEATQIILKDAIRASRIVKDLLAASYKNNMDERPVNLNEIIEELVGIRFHELKHVGVRLVLKLNRNISPVLADLTQMQQVFDNMIRNSADAIKASGTGDRITIRTRMENAWINISFEDNGPGIDEKHHQKIFDPFFTTKKLGEGTGLGLSVVYGIIQRHGGIVFFDADFPSGARFIVRLPVVSPSSDFQEPVSVTAFWKPAKVLLADRERNLRHALTKYLNSLGCKVNTASNGRAALDLALDHDYDMLLIATNLPIMTGFAFYEHVKNQRPELLNRIVFMDDSSAGDINDAYLAPNNLIIRKPFSNNDVLHLFNRFSKEVKLSLEGRVNK